VKSIKQTFGILIVALALFGAYSLVCPKKPVDDSVSGDFRAELEKDGIFLNDDADGTGGKSDLFNSLSGNAPGLPSPTYQVSGKSIGALPPLLFGDGVSQPATPAPQYGQPSDDDLLLVPDLDDAPVWGENSIPTQQNLPDLLELPSLDVPVFDEPKLVPDFDNDLLFDIPADPFEPTSLLMPEVSEMPQVAESAIFTATPTDLNLLTDIPDFPPFIDETLESSSAFTPIDSTTAIVSHQTESPLESWSENENFEMPDSLVSYQQRHPPQTDAMPQVSAASEHVRPLPTVTEESRLTLASGYSPRTPDHPASTGNFAFSNQANDFQQISGTVFPETHAEFQPPPNDSEFDLIPSDLTTPSFSETGDSPTNPAPGVARSSQQRRAAPDAMPYATLPDTQSIDPRVIPHEIQVGPTGQFEGPVSSAQNPMAANPVASNSLTQNSTRPEVMQKHAQIRKILNDDDYQVGHRLITELYMSDLTFAEREHVLQIADKCGWAAFFSSRSFDPYEWGRTIRPTDTLQSLATANGISPELILKINRLEHPGQLTAGKENVKIPQGPFDATIFLDRKEMVITARGLFACRFRIGIGNPGGILEAVYRIEDKFQNPSYIGETGEIESGDPRNPLGTHWIQLDQEIGIHGTNNPACIGTDNAPVEGFSLDNRDVAEVYDILTAESRIIIRK